MRRHYPAGGSGRSWGECARSGRRMHLKDMVPDGDIEGILVAPRWREPSDPQESFTPLIDNVTVQHPAPDLDRVGYTVNWPTYDLETGAISGSKLDRDLIGSQTVSVS